MHMQSYVITSEADISDSSQKVPTSSPIHLVYTLLLTDTAYALVEQTGYSDGSHNEEPSDHPEGVATYRHCVVFDAAGEQAEHQATSLAGRI